MIREEKRNYILSTSSVKIRLSMGRARVQAKELEGPAPNRRAEGQLELKGQTWTDYDKYNRAKML